MAAEMRHDNTGHLTIICHLLYETTRPTSSCSHPGKPRAQRKIHKKDRVQSLQKLTISRSTQNQYFRRTCLRADFHSRIIWIIDFYVHVRAEVINRWVKRFREFVDRQSHWLHLVLEAAILDFRFDLRQTDCSQNWVLDGRANNTTFFL